MFAEVGEQFAPYPPALAGGADIGVADEGYISDRLNPHYAEKFPLFLISPKYDPGLDFMAEFIL